MKKLAIFSVIAFLLAFVFVLTNTTQAWAGNSHHAKVCNDCYTFGSKPAKNYCVKCGKWSPSNTHGAKICNDCYTFKGYKDKCVKCNKWSPSNTHTAKVCNDCYTFGSKPAKNYCVKCGKWIP